MSLWALRNVRRKHNLAVESANDFWVAQSTFFFLFAFPEKHTYMSCELWLQVALKNENLGMFKTKCWPLQKFWPELCSLIYTYTYLDRCELKLSAETPIGLNSKINGVMSIFNRVSRSGGTTTALLAFKQLVGNGWSPVFFKTLPANNCANCY